MVGSKNLLRNIPAVNSIMELLQEEINKYGRETVVGNVGNYLSQLRKSILDDELVNLPEKKEMIITIRETLRDEQENSLVPVVNATGIILHTNLGRAILSDNAQKALTQVAASFCNLEIDLATGLRGSRYSHVEELLIKLTGAEAALVVNNNAAAVLLLVSTFAKDKEVIISRGELVEIGGSFRIPEVMKQGGGQLVEIGTTNRTHLQDYEQAITLQTSFILKVHTSNYHIVGYTSKPSREELVKLAKDKGIPIIEDLGSGSMVDLSPYGINDETTVQEIINTGVDIVAFSGDKLLGGPQAGIMVGKEDLIKRLKNNQLTRALRVDKYTLASLEATLREYLFPEKAIKNIPILRMLSLTKEEIYNNAKYLQKELVKQANEKVKIELVEEVSKVGGGSTPNQYLPTWAVAISIEDFTAKYLVEKLRENAVPIIARIKNNQVLFDLRTIRYEEIKIIVKRLKEIFNN